MVGTDHIAKICMAPEIRSAVNQYGAKHDLDKQFAILHLLVKSLKSEALLKQEDADYFLTKYGKTIASMSERYIPKPKTLADIQAEQKQNEKARSFLGVISQWDLPHKVGWKEYWLKEAEKYPEMPEAKQLIEKVIRR